MRRLSRLLCSLVIVLAISLSTLSCSSDDSPVPEPEVIPDQDTGMDDPDPEEEEEEDPLGVIEALNPELTADNYVLVNDAAANRVYLMDKEANLLQEWELSNNIGNDVFLLPNGNLLASLEADDPKITLGGQGGKLQFIAPDNKIEWNFNYSSEDAETHHDAELLPNGNVIALVWEKRSLEEAEMAGSDLGIDLFPEAVIEVNPQTDEIVWEWHAWDHLIQDIDDTKENFGVISGNPQLIDLNYVPNEKGDIMHANGIAYDAVNDLIFISVNFYHEVWVIDHSTTTAEAASDSGGNYGKGGDLIYRFGNPEAYKNTAGERLFYNNHFPNLLSGEDLGRMLIFSNRMAEEVDQSIVYELQMPETFSLESGVDNEPEVVWSFTDPDLFAPRVSGAVKLPNGNVMITEGDFGIWEVTRDGEVVWKFSQNGFFWRAYHYDKDAPEIQALGL
ncbi:aryl-sulfate sulfotransferase [Poritiphilus flavus]|uniref:Arylsulfotransferase ASST n=1 Tax=Poritiphilus flavus TaxID=2697053 RepID=A0A6L9EHJ0_9FLAO|nr:aryl-sulfate sulfotransferase [Poritiphilus flavus]NAS14191.1 hypothetical protein [Poritiphilus flavus]